jgi:hypothetical protein
MPVANTGYLDPALYSTRRLDGSMDGTYWSPLFDKNDNTSVSTNVRTKFSFKWDNKLHFPDEEPLEQFSKPITRYGKCKPTWRFKYRGLVANKNIKFFFPQKENNEFLLKPANYTPPLTDTIITTASQHVFEFPTLLDLIETQHSWSNVEDGGGFVIDPSIAIYFVRINMEYVKGSIGALKLTNPNKQLIGKKCTVELTNTYSIYSTEEVVLTYKLPENLKMDNITFPIDTNNFEYIIHDNNNKTIKYKLKQSFIDNYLNTISNEYTNTFKMNATIEILEEKTTDYILTITDSLGTVSNMKLPISSTLNYNGVKTKITSSSDYILFEDTDIMPTSKEEVYLDNLNLITYTKGKLNDIYQRNGTFQIIFQ